MNGKKHLYFSFLNTLAAYEVVSRMSQGDKRQEIRYTTEIKKVEGWFNTHYIIKRSPQVLYPVVDNPYMEVLRWTSSLWNELHLSINSDGEIKKIVNLKAIQDYWKTVVQCKLAQQYEGARIQGIIAQLDQLVKNEAQFIAKISQDSFFYYWIKYNLEEYVTSLDSGTDREGESFYTNCRIEQTKNGSTIRGKQKKTAAELEEAKKKWKLDLAQVLHCESHGDRAYNSDRELVKLVQNEIYKQGEKIVRTTAFAITKIEQDS